MTVFRIRTESKQSFQSQLMKFILVVLAALLPAVAYSIGEAGDTEWPKGARIEVELRLSAAVGTNGQVKVSGDLLIRNPSAAPLTIQDPHNRLGLAFLVFDPLGNPVAPKVLAKADPGFETHSLSGRSTYTHHFESLDFITGSALFGYELSPGKSYKIVAVYRPAGPHGPGFTSQEVSLGPGSYCQTLYDEWHKALQAHPSLTEPMWFSTNRPTDLAAVVSQIESNKIAMAYFLCDKIASEGKADYVDAHLLIEVAGIDLMRASDRPFASQDFGANLAKFSAQFAKDWSEGVYKNPSARIAQLLESKLEKREGKSISPLDLVEIRRLGIFALPELIRQIKQHNSRHAFAAYLIITGQRDEYSQYLELNDRQFTNTVAKLDHVKAGVEQMRSEKGADGFEITRKISTALAD